MKTKKPILYLFFITIIFIFVLFSANAQLQTFYCAAHAEFVTDLDSLQDPSTCIAQGFTHTGNLCCSEDDDPNEHYNDPGGIGGCFDKEFVANENFTFIQGREDIIALDGVFFGCNINPQDEILNINDFHTGQQLIDTVESCFQDPNRDFFCSPEITWERANGENRSIPNTFPATGSEGCCSLNQCWNSSACIDTQINDPTSDPTEGFRCIDGNWNPADLKTDLFGEEGFCPDNSQCLVDVGGKFNDNNNPEGDPQCISNGQFINDNFCEDGNFTTRTKFVALQLLELLGPSVDDFTLFCDDANNILNDIPPQLVNTIINNENSNNFCTIEFDNKVRLGTSLNQPLSSNNPILIALGVSSCKNIETDNNNKNDLCWYDDDKKILIFGNEPFSITSTNLIDTLKGLFNSLINSIFGFVESGEINEPSGPGSLVESLTKFDRLYLRETSGTEIIGTMEGTPSGDLVNLVIEYKNFNTNICELVNLFEFNEILEGGQKNQDLSGIECVQEGSTFRVLAQGSGKSFVNLNPEDIWNDLTSKLRVV